MENLRYFLSSQDTNDPVYFGHHFKVHVKQVNFDIFVTFNESILY